MDTGLDLWHQFAAAHPFYAYGVTFFAGTLAGPQILKWFETKGMPMFTDWFDTHQESVLKRAGLTQQQIDDVELREVSDLRKEADLLETKIKARQAASPIPATPA